MPSPPEEIDDRDDDDDGRGGEQRAELDEALAPCGAGRGGLLLLEALCARGVAALALGGGVLLLGHGGVGPRVGR